MCEWDSIKRLASYLGLDAVDEAPILPDPRSLDVICKPLEVFRKQYSPERADALIRAIFDTDFSTLLPGEDAGDALSRDVKGRVAGGDEAYPDYDIVFRRFLRWFRVAREAVLHEQGLKKVDVSLDKPGIGEYIVELKELPCRRLGELSFAYRLHGDAALSRYVEALLGRYEDRVISANNCRAIIEIMSKVGAHPSYFKAMSPEQKLIESRPLIVAISELQLCEIKEEKKTDLLTALSLLLFNIYPTPKLLKFVAKFVPSPDNDALQYDYHAILALNFMLNGNMSDATDHSKKALEYAMDGEKRAYVHILESCISIQRGDLETAANALYNCSTLARDKRMKSTALFYLGIVDYEIGNVRDALEAFRKSRIGLEDELDIMNACNNVGACLMLLGERKAAAAEFENVEYIGRYMSSNTARHLKYVAQGSLGLIHLHEGRYDRALEAFKEALKLSRDIHDKKGIVNQLGDIGMALKAKKEYEAAMGYFRSALNTAFIADYPEGALFAFARIEELMALEGRYEEAESLKQDIIRRNPGIARMLKK